MKLGFVSAILPDQPLATVMETARRLGYDCVEVMCWPPGKAERRYAGVTHINVAELGSAEVEQIRRLISSSGVHISALGYYPNPLSPEPQESEVAAEHLKKVIVACQRLELATCNTFIGRDWTQSVDENWSRFREVWKPLIDFAAEHDVRIGVENCPMLFGRDEWPGGKNLAHSPAIWRRMFQEIPSPHFGLNYDPSHLVWQHMDPVAPLRDFADRVFHVHAKDVRVDRHRLDQVGILAHPTITTCPNYQAWAMSPGVGSSLR